MIRKYKALSLALVAMFAFGAIAQSASAVPLTAPEGTIHLTGEQEGKHKFTTPNGVVECTTASFDGTSTPVAGQINEQTSAPTYTGCSAFGFATAHVKTNGCTYTFTTPTSIGVGVVTWGPTQFHIVCPVGKSIEITPTTFGVSVCTQFVGEQTPTKGHVVGRNVANSIPMDITLETTFEEIHYTGTGGICGDGTTHTNATYIGNTTVKCYSNAAHTVQVDCTFE